jgi:hypothetical protein
MIGEDYKPKTFWEFLLKKGKWDIIRTLFALTITILAFTYTQDIFELGSEFEKYLLIATYMILLASTTLSIYLPYTIYKKIKK